MKIRTIGNKILVKEIKVVEEGEKIVNGIIIPETARKMETNNKEVEISYISSMIEGADYKVGDIVLVSMYVGAEIEVEGEKYLIIDPLDIMAVLG